MFSCAPGWSGTCYVAEDDLIPLMLRLERYIATAEGVMLTITSNPSPVTEGYPRLALNSGDPLPFLPNAGCRPALLLPSQLGVLLNCPGWSFPHSSAHASLDLVILLRQSPEYLGLQACTTALVKH